MLGYLIRRVLYTIPVLFGVALLVFLLFNGVGEDPVRVALGNHATPAAIADLRAQLGHFLMQIVTFDYGRSFNSGEELSRVIAEGATVSLWLTLPPLVIGLAVN